MFISEFNFFVVEGETRYLLVCINLFLKTFLKAPTSIYDTNDTLKFISCVERLLPSGENISPSLTTDSGLYSPPA